MPLFDKASQEANNLAFRQLEATIQRRIDLEKSVPRDLKSPYKLYPTTINYVDIHGFSLLHYAVALGNLEKVKELVEQNADINLKNTIKNLSIINLALAYGHSHILQYLYEKGADFTDIQPSFCSDKPSRTWLKERVLDIQGQLISDYHLKKDFVLIGKQLQFFKPTQVMSQVARRAVEMGDIEFLQELSQQDPKLFNALLEEEEVNEDSKNIVVRAAENGELATLKFLLDKKPSINSTKDYTTTALMAAIQHNYQDVIDYLMTLNGDLDQQDNVKMTALCHAVIADNRKTTLQLLERGAKSNLVNINGNTILHLAILSGSSLLSDLLDRPEIKALLHIKNIYGFTAIDYALWSQNTTIIELVVPSADRETLKPEPTPIAQNEVLHRMHYYLSSQYRDTSVLPKEGHCNAFAFLKIFYTARGMENYFFKTLALMANWEGSEHELDMPFQNNEQMVYQYRNLRELFEQWINDVIWFQHTGFVTTAGISRLAQHEHLAYYQLVGIPKQYDAEQIYRDIYRITANQLRERMGYFARMPAKTQLMFGSGEHGTSLVIEDKKGLHYYDPNFRFQSATQTDPEAITQQLIDYKYILLRRFVNKIDINIQVYCPKEAIDELNKVEILREDELPKSKEEALLFQQNSANLWTPLHVAVVTHSLATFKKLIAENFCDISAVDAFNLTPLMIAVTNNFCEAIQFAIQMPEVTLNTDFNHLLLLANSMGHREIRDVLLGRPDLFSDITSLLMGAIAENNLDLVEKLFSLYKNKIDAKEINKEHYGQPPLSFASSLGNVKMIKCLLDNGASLFIAGAGSTALRDIVSKDSASKKQHEVLDTILIEQNINQVDDLGSAAIHYAIQSSRLETLQKVINKGGEIQLRTAAGASVWDILLHLPENKKGFFAPNSNSQEQRTLMRNLLIGNYKFNLLDQSDKKIYIRY